ncbi:MAG: hypothetical protein BZ136_09150 [Methanosphaera sp. rholeuAM74]|nr:MAG: hypothetical protein BZ136_09150 [Methanosphaera sp. rholeuAM74]
MDWSRKELKQDAMAALKDSYLKCLLVGALTVIASGTGSLILRLSKMIFGIFKGLITGQSHANLLFPAMMQGYGYAYGLSQAGDDRLSMPLITGMLSSFRLMLKMISPKAILAFFVSFLIGQVISMAIRSFILHPMEVSCQSFYREDIERPAPLDCLLEALSSDYFNIVKVQFLKWLFTTLWGMLLIVPGIVKSYEYRLVPYILSEDPHIDAQEALAMSREMMEGEKLRAFVLDLTFLGWSMLSLFTFGLAMPCFVTPYHELTFAGFYRLMKEKDAVRYGEPACVY